MPTLSLKAKIISATIFLFAIFAIALLWYFYQAQSAFGEFEKNGTINAEMPTVAKPEFPDNVCNIHDYGAVPGGEIKNTDAFQKAIADCAGKGGGKVLIPAGKWLTGPIHLIDNIDLHLEDGAELLFSTVYADYLPPVFTRFEGIELFNYSPFIYANGATNIAITGKGILNGQGEGWWKWKKSQRSANERLYQMSVDNVPVEQRLFGTEEDALRPSFVQFINSKNIYLADFTITNSPMWTIHPVYSENILIEGIHVNTNGHNTDGIVIDSSRNVVVQDCNLETGDDSISIKSGLNAEGRSRNRPSENILISRNNFKGGHTSVTIGSEMSGGVRNVFILDSAMDSSDQGIRVKSTLGRGGIVENIWAKNIEMKNIENEAIQFDMEYDSSSIKTDDQNAPIFRNFYLYNISCDKSKYGIKIDGLEKSFVENVSISKFQSVSERGISIKNVDNLKLYELDATSKKKPLLKFENVRHVRIKEATCQKNDPACMTILGEKSEDVVNADRFVTFKTWYKKATDFFRAKD